MKKIKSALNSCVAFFRKKRAGRAIFAALVLCASISAILLPLALPVATTVALPPVYANSFVGVLDDKIERLDSIEGEKIVVIGGSSVAFGLDSALMEKELGRPVVNFGLYAAIGNVAMMELSMDAIGEGDIVILAPETDPQSLSTYFGTDMILKAIDEDPSLIFRFSEDSRNKLMGGLWAHAAEKIADAKKENSEPKGIYAAASFDKKYFDIKKGLRDENVMPLYYDPNTEVRLSPDIVEDEYIDFVNEYVAFCRSRGAEVYFTYSPMLIDAFVDTSDDDVWEFERFLADSLDCEVISVASTYIMDAGYFYDTNYHLNDTGVIYRTLSLVEDIRLCDESLPDLFYDKPWAPELPFVDVSFEGYDENSEYFLYDTMANGSKRIIGLTDAGKKMKELTVPLGVGDTKVMAIGRGAFAGSDVTTLKITSDTNLRNFLDGCMSGSNIKDIWIYYDFENENDKLVPPSDFGGVKLHFPPGSIYSNHYDWQDSSGGYTYVEDAVE